MAAAAGLLAHAGPGSTWQAMVVVVGVVLAAVLLAAGAGLLPIASPGDLLTPLAAAAILASLGLLAHAVISDWIGWGLPLAVVSLTTLLLGATTGLDLRLPAPLPMGAIALAGVSMWTLYAPLTVALHPPPEVLPLSDDATLTVLSPAEDAEVTSGIIEVTVAVENGSIGPGGVQLDALPSDAEEAGELTLALARVLEDDSRQPQRRVDIEVTGCSVDAPCQQVQLPVPVQPGTWELTVDLNRGDGTPLAPPVRTRTRFTAVPAATG